MDGPVGEWLQMWTAIAVQPPKRPFILCWSSLALLLGVQETVVLPPSCPPKVLVKRRLLGVGVARRGLMGGVGVARRGLLELNKLVSWRLTGVLVRRRHRMAPLAATAAAEAVVS